MPYPGGQSPIINDIMENLPPDKCYNTLVDLGVGGGTLPFASCIRKPDKEKVINDIDRDVINVYDAVQNKSRHEKVRMYLPNPSALAFEEISKHYDLPGRKAELPAPEDADKRAAEHLFLRYWSYNSSLKSFSKYPERTAKDFKDWVDDLFEEGCDKLQGVKILNEHYKEVMRLYDRPDVFLFFDVPYYEVGKLHYAHYFTAKDHWEMSDAARKTKACIMIVCNDTPFIQRLYKDFRKVVVDSERTGRHLFIMNYNADGTRIDVGERDSKFDKRISQIKKRVRLNEEVPMLLNDLEEEGITGVDAGDIVKGYLVALGWNIDYVRELLPAECKDEDKAEAAKSAWKSRQDTDSDRVIESEAKSAWKAMLPPNYGNKCLNYQKGYLKLQKEFEKKYVALERRHRDCSDCPHTGTETT